MRGDNNNENDNKEIAVEFLILGLRKLKFAKNTCTFHDLTRIDIYDPTEQNLTY